MNATKNNRIIGMGVGMALAMFAGTAFGACPLDGDKTAAKEHRAAKASQTCCMIACGDADTCTPPSGSKTTEKQVKQKRHVSIRGGPEGVHLGDASFGDLDFAGDNAVLFGPEGKQRHVIRHVERGHDGANVRTEVRIIGPRGQVREFGFDGDDKALSKAGSRIFFTQQIDDDTITIEIRNGTVTATINGKKVPKSRIRREGGKVSILNQDGEVVATVPVAMDGGGIVVGDLDASLLRILLPQPEAPPVMLGIRMSSVDEHTAHEFDLDEGEGIMIVGVIEGLPAEHAGLQEHDVILRIRGAGVATQEKLHNVLLKKEPGDNIVFKIARGDGVREIKVELEAYDADDLGIQVRGIGEPGAFRFHVRVPRGAFLDDKAVEHFMGRIKEFHFDEEVMEGVHKAVEEVMKEVREGLPKFNYRAWPTLDEGQLTFLHGEDPERVFVLAPRRGPRDSDITKDLAELKEQLVDVQRQRDELADELAEIRALLKKLVGRSGGDCPQRRTSRSPRTASP